MSIVLDGSNVSTTGVPNSGTAQNATGTAIDFTGIPAGVKRITVMFSGVSTNGTSSYQVQLGSTTFTTTGYQSQTSVISSAGANASVNTTTGISMGGSTTTYSRTGAMTLVNLSGNIWVGNGIVFNESASYSMFAGGVTLSGTLDRIRITTVNGTDTFDAGSINILYE